VAQERFFEKKNEGESAVDGVHFWTVAGRGVGEKKKGNERKER